MPEAGPNSLGRALRGFFGDYLTAVRGNSRHTVLSYRDAFKLLLRFLEQRLGRPAPTLDFPDLTADTVLAFLDHLEQHRANGVATRNNRLAALHAFARYAAANYPEHLGLCQQLLAVPPKRSAQRTVEYLDRHEMRALLQSPDTATKQGRRDRTLLLALYNTGARVQEILDVRPRDLQLDRPRQVRLFRKGRKERVCPLWPETAAALQALRQEQGLLPDEERPLFRNRHGQPLGRHGVRYILAKHTGTASQSARSLAGRTVHPHMMRHSAACHLLQSGIDIVTISHWLGHASLESTNRYATVDMAAKREAVEKARTTAEIDAEPAEWQADQTVIAWLESL